MSRPGEPTMTATAPPPTVTPPSPSAGPAAPRRTARLIALVVAGILGAVVLAYLGQSLLLVGVVVAAVVLVVALAIFRNNATLVVPALIFSMWFEGLGTGQISLGRVLAGVVPLLMVALIATSRWRPPAFEPRVWLPIALMTAWAWAGGFYAMVTSGNGGWFLQFFTFMLGVAYGVGIAMFATGPEQLERLLKQFIWIGVPIAIIGIGIYFTLGNRIYGLTGSAATYAVDISQLFPLIIVFARREVSRRRRWMYWAMLPVYVGALVATGARGGLIGTAVVLVYIFITLPGVRWQRRLINLVVGSALMVGAFYVAGILNPERFSFAAFTNDRGAGRLDIWGAAVPFAKQHWLTGVGMGGFSSKAIEIMQRSNNINLDLLSTNAVITQGGTNAQNLFLQIVLDMGFIGLVLYLGVIAAAFKNLWDLRKTRWADLSWAFTGALISGLVAGIFASQYNQKFMWVIIGAAGSVYYRRRLTPKTSRANVPLHGPSGEAPPLTIGATDGAG
jgi:O-antigen ligase